MAEPVKKARRRILVTLMALPILIAAFVVGGVFIGYYIAGFMGTPKAVVYPLIFSALGLALSIIASYVVAKRVSQG